MVDVAETLARGIRAHEAGLLEQAIQCYAEVLQEQPMHFDALHMQGVALHQAGKSGQGLPLIEHALRLRADDAGALSNWALVLRALGRSDDALRAYQRIVSLYPRLAHVWSNRGNLLRELGQHEAALDSYRQAVAVHPGYAKAWHGMGLALGSLGRWSEALQDLEKAVEIQPEWDEPYLDRGNALRELGRLDEALQSYDQALVCKPTSPHPWSNRGVVLKRMGRLEEAAKSYVHALVLKPDFVDAMVNYATLLKEQLRLRESEEMNRQALALDPLNSGAHLNLSICLLLRGELAAGFHEYEWRWKNTQLADSVRNFVQPQWSGEDIRGKTILLHAEQGLGDTLQFCRYAPWVAARGARVVMEVQPPLLELFRTLPGVDLLLSRGGLLPEFDVHCPLLSLPRAMGTDLHTIPLVSGSDWGYVQADPVKVARWSEKLSALRDIENPVRIGVVWSGRPEHKNDHNRSMTLAQFSELLPEAIEGDGRQIELHALQKEIRAADLQWLQAHDRLHVWNDCLDNFADTAALVQCMDLVIAVDTSVAHLAAALGKPVWLLLPFSPDWRWYLEDTETSRWYPTMRLFRQKSYGDWSTVAVEMGERFDRLSLGVGHSPFAGRSA